MARSIKSLLSGRYKLTGALARGASVQRGWDRWLQRHVLIEILASDKIDDCVGQTRFIASARALARIEHPNVEALLDYGATEDGAPYHVMTGDGVDLATLIASEGTLSWARTRGILLDVIAGVHALHRQRIVHGGISPHAIALFGETARVVEFGDAEQREHEPTLADVSVDVLGIAALGFTLLTGSSPAGRSASGLAAALARSEAPRAVRAVLVRALIQPQTLALESLRRQLASASRGYGRARLIHPNRLIDVAAAVAAAAMLSLGLWSSVASSEVAASSSAFTLDTSEDEDGAACEHAFESFASARDELATVIEHDSPAPERARSSTPAPTVAPQQSFESARARVQVGSEAQRNAGVSVQSQRFELQPASTRGGLSPAALVERGIDLTHGRPTPEDDPRLPIVDGPLRARALFEAACARDYGKGCHMLGVQIAEGMVLDDGGGAARHYRRGCALDYPRSCAALADLARAGQIVADADRLDAKACRLAGPESSYCRARE